MTARLNEAQNHVVSLRTHCLAISCPGSGKTTTLAAKAVSLLTEGKTVAAVTFTREAADELRARIVREIDGPAKARLVVGTFHSLCLAMCFPEKAVKEAPAIFSGMKSPFDAPFRLAEAGQRAGFILSAVNECGLTLDAGSAALAIEAAREGKRPANAQDTALAAAYERQMASSGLIDFQDILLKTNAALRAKTLSPLAVDALLVDEFQDTDAVQYEWIGHMGAAGAVVTAVGDDDQSIYAFRRALGFDVMSRFLVEFGAEKVLLGQNYRCRREILDAAAKMIAHNTRRIDKTIRAVRGSGGHIRHQQYADDDDEAAAVAEEAGRAVKSGESLCVIARTHRDLAAVEQTLISRNIAYRRTENTSVFDHYEVAALGAVMTMLVSPEANAMDTVCAWRGLDAKSRETLRQHRLFGLDLDTIHVARSELAPEAFGKWHEVVRKLESFTRLADDGYYSMLLAAARDWLSVGAPRGVSPVMLKIAARLYQPKKGDLAWHLATIERMKRAKDNRITPEEPVWVSLMTAHAAKGLEFDRVWMVGMSEGCFPDAKSAIVEERRLAYVAMTRARNRLVLSSVSHRTPSVFLAEAGLVKPAQGRRAW